MSTLKTQRKNRAINYIEFEYSLKNLNIKGF